MKRLRLGVIGLGWFGEIHAETIVGAPNLELAALCEPAVADRQRLGPLKHGFLVPEGQIGHGGHQLADLI